MSLVLQASLVPGLSPAPTLQRYVRGTGDTVGAATGSPITGTVNATYSSVWEFDFTGVTVGDYWALISGVSVPSGPPFAVRVDATDVTASLSWLDLDLITDAIAVSGPVATTGQITTPIIIGDDYLAANGRAFQWTIAAITGYTLGTATCWFGAAYKTNTWNVEGTVSDAGGGNWTLSFDLPKTATAALEEGYYSWSVEVTSAGGTEVTRVRSGRNVLVVDKQT